LDKISFTWIIVIVSLMLDMSLTNISSLIGANLDLRLEIGLFIIISAVYAIGQFAVLRFIKHKSNQFKAPRDLHLNAMSKIVIIVQYVLTSILVYVILQIIVLSYYSATILVIAITISYILAIVLLGLLTKRFFSWFRRNKDVLILLYGLSSLMLSVNAALTLLVASGLLQGLPQDEVRSGKLGNFFPVSFTPLGRLLDLINSAYVISLIVSFIVTWGATVLLLHNYSHGIGRIKYWVIVSLPLVYFLSQFVSLFLNMLSPLLTPNPIFLGILITLLFALSKPAGGILFANAFRTVANNINPSSGLRQYMIISAYGFLLLFVSNQAVVLGDAPYPPFGLATVSFMGLSAFLILVGIYSSAISVSQDSKLRRSIKEYTIKLFDSIGSAHMEQEIQEKVLAFTKQSQVRIAEETGIPSSLSDEDMKQYMEMVLEETKNERKC
jgi:hypothetical protein